MIKPMFLATLALIPTLAHAQNQPALIEAYFSVVLIRGYHDNGGMAYGSGVVVAENEVVTNCHVLRATKQPWVSRGEDVYPITTVRADTWHDLCLVTTQGMPFKPVIRGNSTALVRDQEITAIGHSNGVPAPITSVGEIQGLYPTETGNMIRSSAKFMLGASGSGLFDSDGKLVGINTFKTAGKGGSIHFALPVEWLPILEKLPASTTFPVTGKALWEEDEDKKPFYMRAAIPETRQDWPTLLSLSEQWTQAETNSPDAWFSLGMAQQQLHMDQVAMQSFERAAALDHQFIEALFRAGDIAKKLGDTGTLTQITAAIQAVDPQLIAIFQEYTACGAQCQTR